ncbi:MAG: class I SAM-dependent rRNA methyltransferase [Treponema sp.]|nr:class I SAM-dependent rRNA methyltransferase [Treponema sp.]
MKRIILQRGEERRILAGHPWVYENEIERIVTSASMPVSLEPGEIAEVESVSKKYLGRAFVNPASKIVARLYSPSKEGMDKGFFKRRIREAIYRRRALGTYNLRHESARLVFAEADFLPGLIIDRFVGWTATDALAADVARTFEDACSHFGEPRSWIVVQVLARGMEERREMIFTALEEILGSASDELGLPAAIIERSAAKARELEGLLPSEGLVKRFGETYSEAAAPEATDILIFENGFPFLLNLDSGQKTGHFLDQKENRLRAARLIADSKFVHDADNNEPSILDACTYTGGFAIHVARIAPAARVLAVDSSHNALETLRQNALLNGVGERIITEEADIFEFLSANEAAKTRFDAVILDPPAFAKSHTQMKEALRGYKEINLRALKMIKRGGILISCSCSQALNAEHFRYMIRDAALDADRRLIQLDFRYQAPDHPILVGYDESCYLKCGFYRVL